MKIAGFKTTFAIRPHLQWLRLLQIAELIRRSIEKIEGLIQDQIERYFDIGLDSVPYYVACC